MKVFLDQGDYERLRHYFEEYSEMLENSLGFVDCGNNTINAVISVESGKAKSVGARLECRIAVPERLEISDTDICSVLMNLIDNAVEYYGLNPDFPDKRISVEVLQINETLFVKVSNPISEAHREWALTLRSRKENPELHGYGSKIVKRVAEKYGGKATFESKGGEFIAGCMMFPPVHGD